MPHDELLTRAVSDVVPRKLAEEKLKSGKKMRLYLGIDPTGAQLHLGHSVPLRKLKAFTDAGHQVIFLVGSFTAMIGDPSGRDTLREPLTPEQVKKNFESYKEQASKVLDFSKVDIRYNHEWHNDLTFKDLLGLCSNFTVQQMLERDMYQKRMQEEKPIALTEFLYPLMQGYDSVMLDVDCEVGGNDQLFNMLAGRTLQQAFKKRDKFVLTTKLIEGTDGRKMSKTYDNCIWINDSAEEMFGKLLRIKDELIITYMECVTDIPMAEIKKAESAMGDGANPKDFKMQLAREVVMLYHGKEAADHASAQFDHVHRDHGVPDDMQEAKVKKGSVLLDVMLENGLVTSKSDARRLIEQGGVKLNDEVVKAIDAKAEQGILKVGKRKFLKLS